jgi:hypothetical protein
MRITPQKVHAKQGATTGFKQPPDRGQSIAKRVSKATRCPTGRVLTHREINKLWQS